MLNWYWQDKVEILEVNLSRCYQLHHKEWLGIATGSQDEKHNFKFTMFAEISANLYGNLIIKKNSQSVGWWDICQQPTGHCTLTKEIEQSAPESGPSQLISRSKLKRKRSLCLHTTAIIHLMHYLAELVFCHRIHKVTYPFTDTVHLYCKGQWFYLGSNYYFFWTNLMLKSRCSTQSWIIISRSNFVPESVLTYRNLILMFTGPCIILIVE